MTMVSSQKEGLASSNTAQRMIKVWDPVVRLFHWTVVAACILNLVVLEEGKYWHRVTGYVVATAIAVRVVWGVHWHEALPFR